MARPKSDDKRAAIMEAAIRVIAAQGLGAATATIAREAGIANGSLFTYFPTKVELLNTLYVELKGDMATASLAGMPVDADIRAQMLHAWSRWLEWATHNPGKRRILALLGTSDDITAQSHRVGNQTMAEIAGLLERSRSQGPMRDLQLGFVVALMTAAAEATIDFMLADPASARRHSDAGFEALWRMIA